MSQQLKVVKARFVITNKECKTDCPKKNQPPKKKKEPCTEDSDWTGLTFDCPTDTDCLSKAWLVTCGDPLDESGYAKIY